MPQTTDPTAQGNAEKPKRAQRKTAVVLFNLGAPDGPKAVRPFLFNLFKDPAIIEAPGFVRLPLAWFISRKRAPIAAENYDLLGGASPLLPNTQKQATALEEALQKQAPEFGEVQVFICMRYWHPMSAEVAAKVKAFGPDQVLLLPLYPQFAASTSGSSLSDWYKAARGVGLTAKTHAICCYPTEPGFIAASADRILAKLAELPKDMPWRLAFSAHGLPKRMIECGDPYQNQVEMTAAAIREELVRRDDGFRELDWTICYQSRVGRLEWIGPSTEEEITRAGRDRVGLLIFPIAFVSEHSETLVELDVEYRHLAEQEKVPAYLRAGTVDDSPAFIDALVSLLKRCERAGEILICEKGGRLCPEGHARCAFARPLES
jgi:ferrochelatase